MQLANADTGQLRLMHMAEGHSTMDVRPKPTVTYGKRNKQLPLRGTHFMSSDIFELPKATTQDNTPVQTRRRQAAREPAPDDPPLSEDELETVYGNSATSGTNASPVMSSPSSRTSFELRSESRPPSTYLPFKKKGRVKAINRAAPRPGCFIVQEAGDKKEHPPTSATCASGTDGDRTKAQAVAPVTAHVKSAGAATKAPPKTRVRRVIVQPDSIDATVSRRKIATPVRRLPVDELLMAPSPLEQPDYLRAPDSSILGIEKQDPIADSSSPLRKVVVDRVECGRHKKETPLTSIRKRLKAPNSTHKSIVTLRKKQIDRKPTVAKVERNLGDGFDSSEIRARSCHVKKQRRNGTKLVRGLGALQLQPGPLPKVKFEESSSELQFEPANGDMFIDHSANAEQEIAWSNDLRLDKNDRRVTFSDTLFDEATRAQLSSVSAPKRIFEISSDESEEEDEEEYEDDSDAEQAETRDEKNSDFPHNEAHLHFDGTPSRSATPPSCQPTRQALSTEAKSMTAPSSTELKSHRNPGVTLDFRKSATPGVVRQSFGKQRQMEVNEMIIDDPFVESGNTVMATDAVLEPSHVNGDQRKAGRPSCKDLLQDSRRPRSILRSSTPIRHHQNGTRPEDTVFNTRRNSNIGVQSDHFLVAPAMKESSKGHANQMSLNDAATTFPERRPRTNVVLEDHNGSYFHAASHQLHSQRQAAAPQIMRTNYSDAAASHFFNQRRRESEFQILDSSRAVPETSPQRKKDYMTNLGMSLNVVHRDGDTTWTSSQSLPTVKPLKDLKSLTRSVSREYGTLS